MEKTTEQKKTKNLIDTSGNLIQISLQEVINLLDNHYQLIYVDYRSSLEGHEDEIQESIQNRNWEYIDETTNEWFWEDESDSVDYILKELSGTLVGNYDLDRNDAEEIIDEWKDWIRDEIYNRDNSTPLDDLLRNTGDIVCFYELGYDVNSGSWSWSEDELQEEINNLKEFLKIDSDKHDENISMMLQQASYGGYLVVYFLIDARTEIKDFITSDDKNQITFRNPMIAVIDTCNGSGDHTDLPGHSFNVPFDPQNIFLDKTIKYSYTYSVCGMYPDWCNCTDLELQTVDSPGEVSTSSLHAELEVEALYKKAFEEGGCTSGDMDVRRHKNTRYINEFPCGTHCMDCKTFWID